MDQELENELRAIFDGANTEANHDKLNQAIGYSLCLAPFHEQLLMTDELMKSDDYKNATDKIKVLLLEMNMKNIFEVSRDNVRTLNHHVDSFDEEAKKLFNNEN